MASSRRNNFGSLLSISNLQIVNVQNNFTYFNQTHPQLSTVYWLHPQLSFAVSADENGGDDDKDDDDDNNNNYDAVAAANDDDDNEFQNPFS